MSADRANRSGPEAIDPTGDHNVIATRCPVIQNDSAAGDEWRREEEFKRLSLAIRNRPCPNADGAGAGLREDVTDEIDEADLAARNGEAIEPGDDRPDNELGVLEAFDGPPIRVEGARKDGNGIDDAGRSVRRC